MKGSRPALLASLALSAVLGCRRPGPLPKVSAGTCSGPGYRVGPRPAPERGDLPFEVFESCLWPGDTRFALGARLTEARKPSRAEVKALLEHLWSEAHDALGARFPRKAQICLFDRPGGWSTDFVGCLSRGQEPLAEDEVTDGGEEPPELENHAPFSPAEEGARIQTALGGGATGLRVQVDEAHHRLSVIYPLDREGSHRLACADAVAAFLRSAWTFYPTTTELSAFSFTGTARGRPVLEVEVPDQAAFLAMKPWPLRERLGARTPAHLEAELAAALDRLRAQPNASVRLDAADCQWHGG